MIVKNDSKNHGKMHIMLELWYNFRLQQVQLKRIWAKSGGHAKVRSADGSSNTSRFFVLRNRFAQQVAAIQINETHFSLLDNSLEFGFPLISWRKFFKIAMFIVQKIYLHLIFRKDISLYLRSKLKKKITPPKIS